MFGKTIWDAKIIQLGDYYLYRRGMVPREISLNNTASVILTVLYILSFALIIAEFKLSNKGLQ